VIEEQKISHTLQFLIEESRHVAIGAAVVVKSKIH
jgi:hypothetical protein